MYEVLDVQDESFFITQWTFRSLSEVPSIYVVIIHPDMSGLQLDCCDATRVKHC
jgi:hypothetical protein